MRHLLLAVLMYAASLASWAQPDPFTVAYTKMSGTTLYIYLAKEDGSQAVPIYSSKKSIAHIKLAPGGGKLAFIEDLDLKVLTYTVAGTKVTVNTPSTLDTSGAQSPDFSPDGTKILYVGGTRTRSDIRLINATGGSHTTLLSPTAGIAQIEVAWLPPGSSFSLVHVQHALVPFQYELRAASLDASNTFTAGPLLMSTGPGADFSEISYIDGARTKPNSILVTLNLPHGIHIVEYDITNMFARLEHVAGRRGAFSRDDTKIFFLDRSEFVMSHQIGTGSSSRLTKRGSYGWVDPRP
jgi:hypothetical protein